MMPVTGLYYSIGLINKWLDENNAELDPRVDNVARILKVAEEGGEVASAYIGMLGQNPRKGVSNDLSDVLNELADVAITALCAIQHFTQNSAETRQIIDRKLESIIQRNPEILFGMD